MYKFILYLITLCITGSYIYIDAIAQNPIVRNQFSADPSARVFNGKVYVYPSHDILAKAGQGRPGWFCMEDYHVFSSSNLTDWFDHGVIVSQDNVNWANSNTYSMWAPDCIFRNEKYYFYFPAIKKDTTDGRGFGIGVAISDNPFGPFIPELKPIKNVRGIDPNVFIDKDARLPDGQGQAYLYWSARNIYMAKLKDNMTELASEPQIIANLPEKGLKEGPWLFERQGIYYLTYPHVQNRIERLEYATSNNPMGPFNYAGVIMEESPMNCWTNHQSILEFNGQWYLFYHQNALSPKFDKNRSICADSLFFNSDGTIRQVLTTLRGVGITQATSKIEIDRYSDISKEGATVTFLDTLNTFAGWKTVFTAHEAWVQYNSVDFGLKKFNSVTLRIASETGGTLFIKQNNANSQVITKVKIPVSKDWSLVKVPISTLEQGVHNLVISLEEDKPVEVDWISFE